jgi:hypothetical protein
MARSLDELPREIEPARDLWPGIVARLDAQVPAKGRRTRVPGWLASLAVASVAALAIGLYWHARESTQVGGTVAEGLPPEAQAGVDEGLAAIRDSRTQIEAALAADSGNPDLQAMLVASIYEESRVMWLVADAGQPAGVF